MGTLCIVFTFLMALCLAYLLTVHSTSDVMLVWRNGNIEKKNSLCYNVVCYYNGAQRYEQFLQVGRLYQALILLV